MKTPLLKCLNFYITDTCNLRCQHCWVSATTTSSDELTANEIKNIVDQAIPLGVESIKITGGEPFHRRDIFDILEYIHHKKLKIIIETNGTLLDEKKAKGLVKVSPIVGVSLDDARPEFHDELRGVNGAFKAATNGIKILTNHRVIVEIIMTLYKKNFFQIEEVIKLGNGLGVKYFKLGVVHNIGRAEKIKKHELLSTKEVFKFYKCADTLMKSDPRRISADIPPAFISLSNICKTGILGCPLTNLLSILANGDISICGIGKSRNELILGNIRGVTLQDVWDFGYNNILGNIRKSVPSRLEGVCSICMMKKYCLGYCRAEAYYKYQSLTAPYPGCQEMFEAGLFPRSRLIFEKGVGNVRS